MRDNQLTVDEFGVLDLLRRGQPVAPPAGGAPPPKLRAAFVRAVMLGQVEQASRLPPTLNLSGVAIGGTLDLTGVELKRSIGLFDCTFDGDVVLRDARLATWNLNGSTLRAMRADRVSIDGSLMLRRTRWTEGLVLVGGAIKGDLDLAKAVIPAVDADRARVDGGVFLNDARGTRVDFINASIGRGLRASGLTLASDGTPALRLTGASVGGNVDLGSASLAAKGAAAVSAAGIRVAQSLVLSRTTLTGPLYLLGARIDGSLVCERTTIDATPPHVALNAELATIGGHVLIRAASRLLGGLRLYGAKIGGNLEAIGVEIAAPEGRAINAELLAVGAEITLAGDREPPGEGLPPRRLRIVGDAYFTQARVDGSVYLRRVDLVARSAGAADTRPSMRLNRVTVRGGLEFQGVDFGDVTLNLHNARVGALIDERASWPADGNLRLNGFEYGRFLGTAPTAARERLDWVSRHRAYDRATDFMPQPYTQLIGVLRAMGHDRDARTVAIARQRAQRRALPASNPRRWTLLAWDGICGYGYRPWLAAVWLAVLFAAGAAVFAAHRDAFVPIRDGVALRQEFMRTGVVPAGYPQFQPVVYAADSMLPIINLGQKEYWAPLAGAPPAWFTPFRLLHTALGWFLTTIFVAGVSGLIRRD